MKKIISFVLLLTFFVAELSFTTTAHAATPSPIVSSTVIKDTDGGYYIETVTEDNSVLPFVYGTYSTTTQTKTKTTKYYNSNNVLCWQYFLTGTFLINMGVSATCTDSSAKLSLYNTDYSLHSESHSHSGNKATGTIKMNYKGNIKSKAISITCSKNGTYS